MSSLYKRQVLLLFNVFSYKHTLWKIVLDYLSYSITLVLINLKTIIIKKLLYLFFAITLLGCVSDATNIVRKALNVVIIAKNTKEQLIEETKYYIDNYCQDSKTERPLFLEMNLPDIGNRKQRNKWTLII